MLRHLFLGLVTVFVPISEGWAELTTSYTEARESQYKKFFSETLIPFWEKETNRIIKSHDGKDLAYRWYASQQPTEETKGNILIVHGSSEMMPKYMETIWDLTQAGYNVSVYEQRGHGHSSRETSTKGMVHVPDFGFYIKDLSLVAAQLPYPELPRMLLTHSTGGMAALGYIEEQPDTFAGAFMSSPMIKPKYPLATAIAEPILQAICYINGDHAFSVSQGPPEPTPNAWNQDWAGTKSIPRFDQVEAYLVPAGYADIRIAGWSCGLWKTAVKYGKEITDDAAIAKIKIPIVMAQAGEDTYVNTEEQEALCKRINQCRLIKFDDARHDLYMGRDKNRTRWMTEVISFFDKLALEAKAKAPAKQAENKD